VSIAFMFPGQGAQTLGFLHALPDYPSVRETLQEASEFLCTNVMAFDSEAELTSTVSVQLGLVIAGATFARFCAVSDIRPSAVAGMSVGTYAAALAAGSIGLSSALTLVRRRAQLMEAAFPKGTHGMAVIDGLRLSSVTPLLQGTDVVIANENSLTQHVLAGRVVELDSLLLRAAQAGAHTAKRLRISVASHTPALLGASQELLELAQQTPVGAPRIALYSNRTARHLTTAKAVREELALNMAFPVRWHDTMTALGGLGIKLVLEAPPGHTLTRLASASLPEVSAMAAGESRWDVLLRAAKRV